MIGHDKMIRGQANEVLWRLKTVTERLGEIDWGVYEGRKDSDLHKKAPENADPELWSLIVAAAMVHESQGDICPFGQMAVAVHIWVDEGYPEPEAGQAECHECGERLNERRCEHCDITFGDSWFEDPEKRTWIGLRAVKPGVPW